MKNLIIIALLMCSSVSFGQEKYVTMTTLDKNDQRLKDETMYGIRMNFYYADQNTTWEADDQLLLRFTGGKTPSRITTYNIQNIDTIFVKNTNKISVLILDIIESEIKTVEIYLTATKTETYILDMIATRDNDNRTVLFSGNNLGLYKMQ
tara:strand:- start:7007 stop:7456 length:450 start_codon:yes stop_codon:yes gene_type:complete